MSDMQTTLTVSPAGTVAALRRVDGAWSVEAAPPWLMRFVGADEILPARAEGRLAVLADLAEETLRRGGAINDAIREVRGRDGSTISVLVQGRAGTSPELRGQTGVLLALRDATELLKQRRKAVLIGGFHGILGESLAMVEVYTRIAQYGPTEAPLIITGETGTGKELIARAVHERSKRAGHPFVAVNCSALTSELFESELFGHEKGSFTGAYRQHKGRFERANTGTMFLDEVGDMPPMSQSKMLRALEEGVIERVGGEREQQVDVRIVAATNVALEQAVQMRRFRADLYHRLSVLRIHVPALRDRHGDIPILVSHFLDSFARRYSKPIERVTPDALAILEDYPWPGNVRELRNVMERLVIESEGREITPQSLMYWVDEREYLMPGAWNADTLFTQRSAYAGPRDPEPESQIDVPRAGNGYWGAAPSANRPQIPASRISSGDVVEVLATPVSRDSPVPPEPLTAEAIRDAAARAKGNLTRAAKLLGVHKATLYRHMKALGIDRESLGGEASDEQG